MEHTNLFFFENREALEAAYPDGKIITPVPSLAYALPDGGNKGTILYNNKKVRYEVTVHLEDNDGNTIGEDFTAYSKEVLEGNSAKVKIVAPEIEGYTPTVESVKIEVSEDTEYTFIYRNAAVNEPLTFNILSDGEIYWYCNDASNTRTIEYKKNDGEWTSITSENAPGASIGVVSGDVVQFRGDNSAYATDSYYNAFASDCEFSVAGNIMSLINSTGFSEITTLTEDFTFCNLFTRCSGLISAENLLLPATTLSEGCYGSMFMFCDSLTSAPSLPATNLANLCYFGMFEGCESLVNAPTLPATTLAFACYSEMFFECFSLTTAPALPATTLAENCYNTMFFGCESLTTAPELPATTLADFCYASMFNNCTGLTSAPELPATVLTESSYEQMFQNCENLNHIKCLATDISASNCTLDWVNNVAQSGTFVKAADMEDWQIDSTEGIPEGWIVRSDFGLSQNNLKIGIDGGTKNVEVFSIGSQWTASTNDSWITLSPSTGDTGTTNVLISISSTSSQRQGTVIFTNGNENTTLSIIQKNFSLEPFTIEIINADDGYISIGELSEDWSNFSYSINNGQWYEFYAYDSIYVETGDEVKFKADINEEVDYSVLSLFGENNCTINVYGNIMSLLKSNNFAQYTQLTSHCFRGLFSRNGMNVIDASNLILPATTLVDNCYAYMFECCSGLTSAPALPATTLADNCYEFMFRDCRSLTIAPALPATTLALQCYWGMFFDCRSLNHIECNATNISATYCTRNWVNGVSASGTFVKNANMSSWTTGNDGIPNNWTVEDAS